MAINDSLQQQLIKDLLLESFDALDQFDREMLVLEKGAGDAETLNSVFRIIHTIKGSSGCIGLGKIESVAHVGENLLSLLRDGKLATSPALINALLEYSDALKTMLRSLERTGAEGEEDYTALLKKLQSLQAGDPVEPPTAAAFGLFDDVPPADNESVGFGLFEPVTATVTETELPPAATTAIPVPSAPSAPAEKTSSGVADTAIRVDVTQLDKLMNLVGELVLARNQIAQFTARSQEPTLINATQRLNMITAELQESVMKTRMQPIENIWAKFPRIVRDLAQDLGKEIKLLLDGKETELDRTIIEAIKDPLTHIVRNACDHGIETREARRAAGKPEAGLLMLRAYHEGGQVNIEILDDGRGIDIEAVKAKALQRRLITADQAAGMGDREAFNLIFLPGFSTAERITNVSGRGVGMDVVKTNIERIGGSVDVSSQPGQGTTIKIKIPLTLAIIPALIVTSGGERFAIPQVSLLELVRLVGKEGGEGIETLYGAPVYRLRGRLLPLAFLNRELKLEASRPTSSVAAVDESAVNIVVLQADGRQFGLIVDAINDSEEIVVKPLGKQLKGLNCFAGATIMGDGRVALILDVLGLAQQAQVVTEVRDRTQAEKSSASERPEDRQTLLLFQTGASSRMAIPLSAVARLEEFSRAQVERSGDREVVQYRGQILPLINVARHLPGSAPANTIQDPLQVVVYSGQGRSVGLVVGKIDDIVEQSLVVRGRSAVKGILGSAVIQDRVTDLLDVPGIILAEETSWPALAAA
jgi:two-component system, chemotaxis family, sensor kinase CheA